MTDPNPLTPPPLRTNDNPFARHTMKVRVPEIIRETARLDSDLDDSARDRLNKLAHDLESNVVINMIQSPAEDYMEWQGAYLARDGDAWLNTEWFYAETFLYRHLIEIVGWFETGHDPFSPKKREEYAGSALWEALSRALDVIESDQPQAEKLRALIHADLWGNSIDLSYALAASHGDSRDESDLLADHAGAVVDHLMARGGLGRVDFILDNTGTELAMDAILADALLDGVAESVRFHVKWHPTYVSDSTTSDVQEFLAMLSERGRRGSRERALADRLSWAMNEGRLEIRADRFWNSSGFLWEKQDLAGLFGASALVIAKGDMNYRRLVGDALWDSTTPFAEVTGYLPAPLLALRTLKSPTIVGLAEGVAEGLDKVEGDPVKGWRSNGKRGVIQFKA